MLQWIWGCNSHSNILISILLDKYPEGRLLDHIVALLLIFWRTLILFSLAATPLYIPTNRVQGFNFSISSPKLNISLFFFFLITATSWASQVALVVKNPSANAGDMKTMDSIPGLGLSPGGEHYYPLQYSCLENPMDRGVWWATVHRVSKGRTQLQRLSIHTHNHLTGVRWLLTVTLIYMTLRISDVEYFFKYMVAISMSSLEKHLFKSSVHLLIGLCAFFDNEWEEFLVWILIPY